jgi:hypothetical protein
MTGEALQLSYRMERHDFVALTNALTRRSIWRPILIIVVWYLAIGCFMLAAIGDSGSLQDLLMVIATGQAPWWFYPVLLIGPALALLRPYFLTLVAARVYPRNALADKTLRFTFNSDAIEGGMPEIQSRFLWSAIKSIVETPAYAFLLISRREALIVPRRAFATPDDYDALISFARARMVANRPATKA